MTQRHLLMVDGYGDYVGLRGELLVLKSGKEERSFPFEELESVILARPHASVSVAALRALAERGIGLALLGGQGRELVAMSPRSTHAMTLGRRQLTWRDDGVAAQVARRCVFDKVRAQLAYVESMLSSPTPDRIDAARQKVIKRAQSALNRASLKLRTLKPKRVGYESELFTLEARAARAWWRALGAWLPTEYGFEGRRQRGEEPDPFNAALNYGYAILASRLTQLLIGLGFDPHLGALHADDPKRASLTYDLIELYRQRYVDAPLLRCALSRDPWELDDGGMLGREARREVAQAVLEALDPSERWGLPAIRRDLEGLREALLSDSSWRPSRPRRWSCPR